MEKKRKNPEENINKGSIYRIDNFIPEIPGWYNIWKLTYFCIDKIKEEYHKIISRRNL